VTDDIDAIRDVERSAGQQFVDVGMPEIAAHEPMGPRPLAVYIDDGRAWVAVAEEAVVGYVVVDVMDDAAHVEQISVAPAFQRRGICRALIDTVAAWARPRGLNALTLTTFRDVPWNRPLYEHLGFRVLGEDELSPALIALREEETRYGLDAELRVVMRRKLLD
jgi:ribosomal protein S18 acetylase RimI-like enzyme